MQVNACLPLAVKCDSATNVGDFSAENYTLSLIAAKMLKVQTEFQEAVRQLEKFADLRSLLFLFY